MISPSHFKRTTLAFSVLSLLTFCGCQSLSESARYIDDSMPWNSKQAEQRRHEQAAARIVAIWSHDVLSTPKQGAIQGFGGRMYFYNRRQEAVKVEGQLIVYAFDDTGKTVTDHSKMAPTRKYIFRADQLQSHLSESELGPSYSFWIPWQKIGGQERKISLVPVFIPEQGEVINGLFSKAVLPGKTTTPDGTTEQDQLVNAASGKAMRVDTYTHRNANTAPAVRNTQTIDLSPNLTRHMATAPPQRVAPTSYSNNASEMATSYPTTQSANAPYVSSRRPTGIHINTNPSGLKSIKLGPPKRHQ